MGLWLIALASGLVGAVVGALALDVVLIVLLRRAKRRAAETRAVIHDPCDLIEPGSWLWYLTGCFLG